MKLPSAFLLRLCLLGSLGIPLASANTYTVTNGSESGPGSLRQAVLDANAHPGLDTIEFDPSVTSIKLQLFNYSTLANDPLEVDQRPLHPWSGVRQACD